MKNILEGQKATPVDHLDGNLSWRIPSTNGRVVFECRFIGISEKSNSYICFISIEGDFFKRGMSNFSYPVVNDFQTKLPQVLLSDQALTTLLQKLKNWLTLNEEFSLNLTTEDEGDQIFSLSIGRGSQKIYSPEKPTLCLDFACPSSMNGQWSYIVDQSCISIGLEGLTIFLSMLNSL